MRTDVGSVLFGRARRLILGWLLGHPHEAFFLRQLVRQTRLSPGSVQRELNALVEAGLVTRQAQGRQVYFQADRSSPVFPELRSLFAKTAGLVDVLRDALSPLTDRIVAAFVFGSAARNELRNDSDVDLLIVGSVSFGDVVDRLGEVQRTLGREINPTVYPVEEFQRKLAGRHHFLTSVLKTPVMFVMGGNDDLEGLGADESLAGATPVVEGRDREPPVGRRPRPARQPARRPQH